MKSIVLFFAVLAVLLLTGCASTESARTERTGTSIASAPPAKATLAEYETFFDNAPFYISPESSATVKRSSGRSRGISSSDSTMLQTDLAPGFRIQLYSSSDIDEATSMKSIAIGKIITDSVYIVYDPPVYKVRIGDFRTRVEAVQTLRTVIARGFPDSWIVPDQINIRRHVRVR